jgi:hypothetical protein
MMELFIICSRSDHGTPMRLVETATLMTLLRTGHVNNHRNHRIIDMRLTQIIRVSTGGRLPKRGSIVRMISV